MYYVVFGGYLISVAIISVVGNVFKSYKHIIISVDGIIFQQHKKYYYCY